MEEIKNHPWSDDVINRTAPRRSQGLPTGRRELAFSLAALICGMLLCNFTLFGGLHLGFALGLWAYIFCAAGYLMSTGCKPTPYSTCLLLLSLCIAAGYGRSADGFVKTVMAAMLMMSVNLGLCLLAGQNRHDPGSANSIGDVFSTIFTMGCEEMPHALSGLFHTATKKSTLVKKFGAILIGLLIMVPVLAILLPLMIKADAAFEGMMDRMPEIELAEILMTAILGAGLFCLLYSKNVALAHRPKAGPAQPENSKGINKLTVNTVLVGVCAIYTLYLISQLAYFVGGFAGILPEEYTLAQYARRGFFEMSSLCALNIGIVVFAVALVRKHSSIAPLSTRLLCLFIGLVTVFLVAAASAKMINYISGYGLTRLRLMTQLIIVFSGITAVTVSVNLFLPKPRYMPVLIIAALVIGGTALWADVDTVVAAYNVNAYQSGKLSTVDVEYLGTLSSGAIPQIKKLTKDKSPEVAMEARDILEDADFPYIQDFRSWNYADHQAQKLKKVMLP